MPFVGTYSALCRNIQCLVQEHTVPYVGTYSALCRNIQCLVQEHTVPCVGTYSALCTQFMGVHINCVRNAVCNRAVKKYVAEMNKVNIFCDGLI